MNPTQQDVGIKIAQPGYNVKNCADYQLIFNSSWPTISILLDLTFSYNNYPGGTVVSTTSYLGTPGTVLTYTHNLGFFAFSQGWFISGGIQRGRLPIYVYENKIVLDIFVLTSEVYYSLQPGQSINIKIYNIDLQKQQTYSYLEAPALNLPYDSKYGIKISKNNKNIDSPDLRDFILHSRAPSPQVLSVVTQASIQGYTPTSGGTIVYNIPKNYIPWAFGYVSFTDSSGLLYYYPVPYYSQAYPKMFIETNVAVPVIVLPLMVGALGTIIVLRDPLFTPSAVRVVY